MHRLDSRIRRLNELGFDVAEIDIITDWDGSQVRIQPKVVDAGHHSRRLLRLTGLDVEENQARRLLNDLDSYAASTDQQNEDEEIVAHQWLTEVFEPVVRTVPRDLNRKLEPAEVFHEVLEHRWFLSEQAGHEVDTMEAARSYVDDVLAAKPDEKLTLPPTTPTGQHCRPRSGLTRVGGTRRLTARLPDRGDRFGTRGSHAGCGPGRWRHDRPATRPPDGCAALRPRSGVVRRTLQHACSGTGTHPGCPDHPAGRRVRTADDVCRTHRGRGPRAVRDRAPSAGRRQPPECPGIGEAAIDQFDVSGENTPSYFAPIKKWLTGNGFAVAEKVTNGDRTLTGHTTEGFTVSMTLGPSDSLALTFTTPCSWPATVKGGPMTSLPKATPKTLLEARSIELACEKPHLYVYSLKAPPYRGPGPHKVTAHTDLPEDTAGRRLLLPGRLGGGRS